MHACAYTSDKGDMSACAYVRIHMIKDAVMNLGRSLGSWRGGVTAHV